MMNLAKRLLLALWLAIGLTAQEVPEEMPQFTFGTTVVSSSGLEGRIYHLDEGTLWLPRFNPKKSVGTIYTNSLNVPPQDFDQGFPGITDRFEWFAIDYTGRFWIEQPGVYQFRLTSDDGARLRIDDKMVIDMDGLHPPATLTANAHLSRGVHRIRVSYYQGPRTSVALVLSIAPPGESFRIFDTGDYVPPEIESQMVRGKISNIRH